MIRTYDEFVDLLNEKGFLLLTGRDYLSVEQVTDVDNWYTDTPLDPWSWKDKLATRRDGAYSHMFAGQCELHQPRMVSDVLRRVFGRYLRRVRRGTCA